MKYAGLPLAMRLLFAGSFKKNLTRVLCMGREEAAGISRQARAEYRRIIKGLPEFEKGDRFTMNAVNCALLISFVKFMKPKPTVEEVAKYYSQSMMIAPMKLFCRLAGKNKFSRKDIESMKKTAAFRAADRNPYSWNMDFYLYPDGSGYEARFTKCGICTLMTEHGLKEYIPAMCALDYDMSRAGGASEFVRKHTLASGGPYCDCGYLNRKTRQGS